MMKVLQIIYGIANKLVFIFGTADLPTITVLTGQ